MFLACNLSAIFPLSTFTKYHLLASQYPWWINQLKLQNLNLLVVPLNSLAQGNFQFIFKVDCSIFGPPTLTWRFVNDNDAVVAGHVSNGDFHWKSQNPVEGTDVINGQIRTAIGCTIPLLIKLLKDDPTVILL